MTKKIDRIVSLRGSRKLGKADGRESLPDLSVAEPHSPFIDELLNLGQQKCEYIAQKRSAAKAKANEQHGARFGEVHARNSEIADIESDINFTNSKLLNLDLEYEGHEGESNSSRVSTRRYLSGIWYYPILIVSIVGEIVITRPAFETLFQDNFVFALLSTLAASAMSIGFAHIFGIALKRSDDRRRKQPNWVLKTLIASSVIIVALAVALSIVRANSFKATDLIFDSNQIEKTTGNDQLSSDIANLDSPSVSEGDVGNGDEEQDPLLQENTEASDPINPDIQDQITFLSDTGGGLGFWSVFFLFLTIQLSLLMVATLCSYFHYSSLIPEQKRYRKSLAKLRKDLERSRKQLHLTQQKIDKFEEENLTIDELFSSQLRTSQDQVKARAQAYWGANIRERSDSPGARSRHFNSPELTFPAWYRE